MPIGRRGARPLDLALVEQIRRLISRFPTYGYRRLWAWLRFREGIRINRKAVYRVLERQNWFVHQRVRTPRPRVRTRRSQSSASNLRWTMDVTHIECGRDGWRHLTAVIDCHDREIVGYEFALRVFRFRVSPTPGLRVGVGIMPLREWAPLDERPGVAGR